MSQRDEGYFTSRDGTRLFWRSELPEGEPKSWVGVVHGYGDHSGRYLQPMQAFASEGYGVLAFDYRGHGRADGPRADCNAWSDFVDDLKAFFARLTETAQGKPVFLVAHSHGALISTHFVGAGAPPELKGLVLSAPFYALAFEPPPLEVLGARLIKGLMPGLKVGNELKPEQLSRDLSWQEATRADPYYLHHTTPRWFFGCQAAQQALQGLGPKVTLPVLMLAGTADPIASMPAAKAFFETVGSKDKTYKEYGDYRHEVLMEVGKEQVWSDVTRWISAHL